MIFKGDYEMNMTIGEIFDEVIKAEDEATKLSILEKHYIQCTVPLKALLLFAYDKKIKSLIPEGTPPIKVEECPNGFGYTSLKAEARKMNIFASVNDVPCRNLKPPRRESLFFDLYAGIDQKEREYLVLIKDKKLDLGISPKKLKKLIPELAPISTKKVNKKKKPVESESLEENTNNEITEG